MVGKLITVILVTFVMPPVLTCAIETPIIKKFLKVESILYICAVNVLTNVPFGMGSILIWNLFGSSYYYVYVALCEALIIPISEALLFIQVTDNKKRCFIGSYLSNAVSFLTGILVHFLLSKTGLV